MKSSWKHKMMAAEDNSSLANVLNIVMKQPIHTFIALHQLHQYSFLALLLITLIEINLSVLLTLVPLVNYIIYIQSNSGKNKANFSSHSVYSSLFTNVLFCIIFSYFSPYIIPLPWSRVSLLSNSTLFHLYSLLCAALINTLLYYIIQLQHPNVLQTGEDNDKLIASKNQFLSSFTHDFRTPLHAVLGGCQVLKASRLSAEQHEHIDVITAGGRSLLSLINCMLDLHKLQSGSIVLNPHRTDLYTIVEKAIEIHVSLARSKRLELSCILDSNVPQYVLADSQRIEQILLSLIDNAVKYTEQGTVSVKLQLVESKSAKAATDMNKLRLLFTVADNGLGIDSSQYVQLFNKHKFDSGSGSTNAPNPFNTETYSHSSGLGLYLCKHLCEAMKGSINVKSTLGLGSTFYAEIEVERCFSNANPHADSIQNQLELLASECPADQLQFVAATFASVHQHHIIAEYLKPFNIRVKRGNTGKATTFSQRGSFPAQVRFIIATEPFLTKAKSCMRTLSHHTLQNGDSADRNSSSSAENSEENSPLISSKAILVRVATPIKKTVIQKQFLQLLRENLMGYRSSTDSDSPDGYSAPINAANFCSKTDVIEKATVSELETPASFCTNTHNLQLNRCVYEAAENNRDGLILPHPTLLSDVPDPFRNAISPAHNSAQGTPKQRNNHCISANPILFHHMSTNVNSPALSCSSLVGSSGASSAASTPIYSRRMIRRQASHLTGIAKSVYQYLSVLIVDDSIVNVKVAANLLRILGVNSEHYDSGAAVLKRIQDKTKAKITHVLTDIHMPEMDGIQLAQHIQQLDWLDLEYLEKPQIIGFTASPSPELKEKCLSVGMKAFLAKPVEVEELAGALGLNKQANHN
jgi:signal transduction histidine kinase/CheY-like chemotaxis protein